MILCFPSCSTAQGSLTGPEEVSSQEQGSLTVQCQYASCWKDYGDKPEQLVKENCVSIRDNQTNFIFTVTMEDLRMSDADIYWCEIMRVGYDHLFKVCVSIDSGVAEIKHIIESHHYCHYGNGHKRKLVR
eukprot:XP_017453307.1 PREDICTED: CMRF35-like molecule 3 [Rattus norvegicus]